MFQDLLRQAECKRTIHVWSVHNSDGEPITLQAMPNICASPFCKKCVKERQLRLLQRYLPYLDDEVYPRRTLRHIIATTPSFPRSELGQRLPGLLRATSRFHEKMRKSYGYPFNAVVVTELKYNPAQDTYYFHCHYGVLSFVNIGVFRKLWCKAMGQELVVKFPVRRGKPQYQTGKHAFIEYATRRKAEQALTMPAEDYYNHLMNRQLMRRVGFTKSMSRIMTTIRKKYSRAAELPDGFYVVSLGNLEASVNFQRFWQLFRDNYAAILQTRAGVLSPQAIAWVAFMDSLESIESPSSQDAPEACVPSPPPRSQPFRKLTVAQARVVWAGGEVDVPYQESDSNV